MPNNDYILRSDALKAILGVSIYDTIEELEGARTIAENTWADGLYDAYKIIEEEVDAADVEPVRRGYWYFRGGRPCCSVCNTKALWKDEGGTGGFSHEFVGAKSKWCPECGAKMDKEADNGDK